MKNYKYTGKQPVYVMDVTGRRHYVQSGDIVLLKQEPSIEGFQECKPKKSKLEE